MPQKSPIQSPRFGRTAAIAAAILAGVAVIQLGSLTVAFFRKPARNAAEFGDGALRSPPLKIDVTKLVAESPPPEDPQSLGVDPLVASRDERPPGPQPILPHAEPIARAMEKAGDETGTGAPPRPRPIPLEIFTHKTDPRFGELIEQGKLLRNSGDTAGALVKFREAEVIEPANAMAIAEQADTFEKMSLPDKAAEQWKRIINLGARAGVLYSLAQSRLHMAVQMAVQETIRTTGGGPAGANGKALSIGTAEVTEEADPAAAKKFVLGVPVQAGNSEAVAVREMKVFVLFYERMNGRDIAKTVANVSNRWTSSPVDWKDGEAEILEVSYELPALQARTERREYYGYIVRLYYRGHLQDAKAEPASLLQKFPAPATLSD